VNRIDESSVYVIVNDGWQSDPFILQLEKHLGGNCHGIGEEEEFGDDYSYSRQVVGFGGESWRGVLFRRGHKVIAAQLIANSDKSPADVAVITCGLALLTHNKFAKHSDIIPA